MVKLCPALRDRSNSAAFYPVKQVAPRTARRLLANETGKFSPENLRDKMPRRRFIPLSRVPLSLQPPHFVAVAGYAALPIGRMSPRKNPSLDFSEDRRFALQISGLLSRASMRSLLIGKKE